MEFGYFTLSDNHYDDNVRGANQLVRDITAEALYADELGMNSVWIGEHHFNSLGVLSCPDLVLASIAARTSRVRLAPAVTVSPLHNPIRIAEQWATLDLLSTAASTLPPAGGTTAASTCHSTSTSPTTRASSRKASRSCRSCGKRRNRSPTTGSTTTSTMCASHRGRSRTQCRPTSLRSPSRRSSWPPGSTADSSLRRSPRR